MSKKLTLVIGAGASNELGLPTGAELKAKISNLLDIRFQNGFRQDSGDVDIYEALKVALSEETPPGRDINPYLGAAWRIRDAMHQAISIDNFLDNHQGDKKMELCGKLAISKSILEAERRSILFINPESGREQLQYSQIELSWLSPFFKVITENCRIGDLKQRLSELVLIVFNYDRCVEHYLYHALQNYYGIDGVSAATLLENLEVYHPYGTVGRLPWQSSKSSVPFGGRINATKLLSVGRGIKTFTEGTDPDSSEILQIRAAIASSRRVLFLGFAFHRLNIQLIRPDINTLGHKKPRRFYATAKGISSRDCGEIQNELANLGGLEMESVELRNNLACRDIFSEYTRGLSLL